MKKLFSVFLVSLILIGTFGIFAKGNVEASAGSAACAQTPMVGLLWNGTQEELRSINSCTGVSARIGTIPEVAWIGPTALNKNRDILYIAGGISDPTQQLFKVNVENSSTIRVPLTRSYTKLFVRSDDALVGLSWTGVQVELHQINVMSGSSTRISVIPDMGTLNAATIDTQTNLIFVYGWSQSLQAVALYQINATTGRTKVFPMDKETSNLHMDYRTATSKRLIGLSWNGAQEELRVVKPAKGTTSFLGIVEELAYLSMDGSDVDQASHILYQLGYTADTTTGTRLFAIQLTSGAPTTDVVLDAPFTHVFVTPFAPLTTARLTLSIAPENSTQAQTKQIAGGSQDVPTLILKLRADNEDVSLLQIKLDLTTASSSADAVQEVMLFIKNGSTTVLGTFSESTGEATFGDGVSTFYTLPQGAETVATLFTDIRSIGTAAGATADSGDELVFRLDAEIAPNMNDSVVAKGVSSNKTLTYNSNKAVSDLAFGTGSTQQDLTSNIFYIRRIIVNDLTALKLYTTVPVDGTPATLMNGSNLELFRFRMGGAISANQNAALDLNALDLAITLGTSTVTITNARILRTDNPSITVLANATSTTQTRIVFDSQGVSKLSSLENVLPGTAAIFVVKADISGVNPGETLFLSIPSLGSQATEGIINLTAGDLVWSDNDDSTPDDLTSWTAMPFSTVVGQTLIAPAS